MLSVAPTYLGQDEFNFANWAKAVRKGNTFMTTGPLLLFQADGHPPGEEITLGIGGGTVEVSADAKSFVPFHHLEIVLNGRVVGRREEPAGTREMRLQEKVQVSGPGWLGARCVSRGKGFQWAVPTASYPPPPRPRNNLHSAGDPAARPATQVGMPIAAHTSPVYVRVPGQELFSPPAAAYFLTLIEGSQEWVENLATRPDRERFERVRKVLREAHAKLHERLHEHTGRH